MNANRRIVLLRRPSGMPSLEDFGTEDAATPPLGDGEMLVANRVISIDPAVRGWLDDRPSYMPPIALGAPVRGMTLGEIVETRNPAFPKGTLVRALANWERFSVLGSDALGLEIVRPGDGIPAERYMGALGPVGLTAWVGLHVIAGMKPGDTVLVSAAAGATGSVAGQLARIAGCRVIGLAGSDEKLALLRNIGFDDAINYRTAADLGAAIRAAAPRGIDVYFDNVGGRILEAVLPTMNTFGSVAVCGMIGDYNDADNAYGVKTLWQLVVNRITMRGFLTYDHADRLAEAQGELESHVRSGALVPLENIRDGLETAPAALIDLLSGRTSGKTLVRV